MKVDRSTLAIFPGILILLILMVVNTGCRPESTTDSFIEEVYIADRLFELELALTPEQRARGLMGRESMTDNEGMLFVFPDEEPYPAVVNFWMKGTLMPIDVIFIERDGVITAIYEMQPPEPGTPDEDLPVYSSKSPVQFVVELRGGLAAELGLQPGEMIILRNDYLLQLAE